MHSITLWDTIFVGQFVGPYGIAALSIAFPIQMLFGAFAQTFGYGAASIISRRLGEKRPDQAAAAAGNALIGAFSITLILAVITYLLCRPVILFFGATEEILPYTEQYIRIILIGIPFLSIKMCSGGILRAEGQARASMTFMVIGAVLNTILDPSADFRLFDGYQGSGACHGDLSGHRSDPRTHLLLCRDAVPLPFSPSAFTPRLSMMSDIISLGFATFVRQSGTSMMSTLVNNLLRFYGGSLVIAAYGMIIRLMIFIMMPMFGLVHGFQPIAGYNYGAKNHTRVRSVLATSVLMATLFASMCWLFIMRIPSQILSVFSSDPELLAIASPALRIVMGSSSPGRTADHRIHPLPGTGKTRSGHLSLPIEAVCVPDSSSVPALARVGDQRSLDQLPSGRHACICGNCCMGRSRTETSETLETERIA